MNITFEMAGTYDVNAANPCCCPEALCADAEIEYQSREVYLCKGGFTPNIKTEDHPGFDLDTYGVKMPLYKTKTVTSNVSKSGNISSTWKWTSAGVVHATYKWSSSVGYNFTTTVVSEYEQPLHHWDAGSEPLGYCPPESLIFAGSAGTNGTKIDAAVDGIVPVTLLATDVRPEHPTEVDGDGHPLKLGTYEWRVDGSSAGSTDAPELLIHLTEGDTTCHEYIVRHVCGGAGKWSEPRIFSLNDNPCCKEPEAMPCTSYTTGNPQWSASQEYVMGGGYKWTSASTPESGSASTQSGTGGGCIPPASSPTNIPNDLESNPWFAADFPFYWMDDLNSSTVSVSITQVSTTETITWIANTNNTFTPNPDDDPPGWVSTAYSESGSVVVTNKTLFSNDQNQGTASVDALFNKAAAMAKGYTDTWGWGNGGSSARADGGYPETQGGTAGIGILFVRFRQIRHRWKVPDSHDGSAHKTQWNVGRFHDRWMTWRGEYYEWAVKKYAFLQKPKKGDDNYPKLSDFWNDPSTTENEAKDALKSAIDALDAIKDPGKAPEEPTDLKPEIVSSPEPWTWNDSQGEQPDERIDACDPTKYARELHKPEEPKRDDFATDEQYKAAVESYKSALATYNAAVAARKAASKRQSPWFIITPDKWSDYREKPDPVPPLPDDPTEDDKKARELAGKRYNFLLERFNSTHHASLLVCNVRHTCNIGDPNGEIENWDLTYPTTSLPALDPAKEDPARWAEWY